MASQDDYLIFLSHSGVDTWVAKQVGRHIEAAGASTFLDEAHISVGADFEEDILKFLERARELVALITPWALERPYVWAEMGAAWGRRIPIIGLLQGITVAELQSKPGIPVFLKKRDMIPLNNVETYLGELRQRVRAEVGD